MLLRAVVISLGFLSLCLVGCTSRNKVAPNQPPKNYDAELPLGASALRLLSPDYYPRVSLQGAKREDLLAGIEGSLKWLKNPSAAKRFPISGVTQKNVEDGLLMFKALIERGVSDEVLNQELRLKFNVYTSVGFDNRGTVLFTGYYTPIFAASKTKSGRFQHPIHRRPDDLVPGATSKDISAQKLPDGSTKPYPTRGEIMADPAFTKYELFYLPNAYEAYDVTIQGSAKLKLEDGTVVDVGYHGTNGYEYTSVGKALLADGKVQKSELNRDGLKAFSDKYPEVWRQYMAKNQRYVFFTDNAKGGPYGSLGFPVTTDVSLALDKDIFPPSALCFVNTQAPDGNGQVAPYSAFRLDQDTGGAIRAGGPL